MGSEKMKREIGEIRGVGDDLSVEALNRMCSRPGAFNAEDLFDAQTACLMAFQKLWCFAKERNVDLVTPEKAAEALVEACRAGEMERMKH